MERQRFFWQVVLAGRARTVHMERVSGVHADREEAALSVGALRLFVFYCCCICYIGERPSMRKLLLGIHFLSVTCNLCGLCACVYGGSPFYQRASVHWQAHAPSSSPDCRAHPARPHLLSAAKAQNVFAVCRLSAFAPGVPAVFFARTVRTAPLLCRVFFYTLGGAGRSSPPHARRPALLDNAAGASRSWQAPARRPKVPLCDVYSTCVLCWLLRRSNV